MAGATGLEPAASCVTGRRSNQLNYAPAYIASLLPDCFPSVPSASQLCPKLPESAVTGYTTIDSVAFFSEPEWRNLLDLLAV